MSQDLDPDLRDLLANTPKLTPNDLAELGTAVRELDNDPAFIAELNKSRFIETLLQAMNAQGVTQSELARRWGKTRQYVSKVFAEDRRVNFTLESMAELATLLGLRLDVRALSPLEESVTMRLLPDEGALCVGTTPARKTTGIANLSEYRILSGAVQGKEADYATSMPA